MSVFSRLFMILISALSFILFASGGYAKESKILPNQKSDKHYYLIPKRLAPLLEQKTSKDIIKSNDDSVLMSLTFDEVEVFSEKIHQQFNTCGGFIEVSEAVNKQGIANFSLQAKPSFALRGFAQRPIRFANESKKIIAKIDPSRFENTLKQLVQFPDRSARTETGKQAALWLRDRAMEAAKSAGRNDVQARLIATDNGLIQDSVVIRIPGKTNKPGVLVGGHMDTFRSSKPGADDDGTGTITALEVFRAIMDSKVVFERDIYVAFYAAEELGLIGSGKVVEVFKQEKIPLQAALQFDMTGYRSGRDPFEFYFIEDHVSPQATEFARDLAVQVLGIPKDKIGKTKCGYACSDHANWDQAGVAAVFPFEASFANYNHSIHTGDDTMEKLDMNHALKYTRLGIAFVSEIAEPSSAVLRLVGSAKL